MQENMRPAIPKIIHYCWFGRGPKSSDILYCMDSWRKYFPDYEIREWNEDSFDVSVTAYTRQAYDMGKWAFVSDYARLYIIYHYGGIYFDTDVEVRKDFRHMLSEKEYMGFENVTNNPNAKTVATGLGFAAEPGNPLIRALMEDYHGADFTDSDGKPDLTPCSVRNTRLLKKMGLKTDGSMQTIGNLVIYPFDYFCGMDMANGHLHLTENTCTIHHYTGSWHEEPGKARLFFQDVLLPLILKMAGTERYDRLRYTMDKWASYVRSFFKNTFRHK